MLARDVIEVAAPIIRHSPVLGPIDLLAVIAATGVDHHRLIARRTALSAEVIRALRLTGDAEVRARLDNNGTLPPRPTEKTIDTSAASRHARALPEQPVRSLAFPFSRPPGAPSPHRRDRVAPAAAPHAANATRLDRAFRSILSAAQIVGFARSGQLAAIIAAMAEGLGSARPISSRRRSTTRAASCLAIMLKALRLDDMQAQQVFLLASPSGREVQSFFPLSDLYAGMEPDVAETLVGAWREAATIGKTDHEPHLAENGERAARRRLLSRNGRQRRRPTSRSSAPSGAYRIQKRTRPSRSSIVTTQRSGSKRISRSDALR